MITKGEIDEKSEELGVNTSDVQRDYVFGWLLSGIYNKENALKDLLILKGGNGFRKAYFEHARYSNDLDFSAQVDVNPELLEAEIKKACNYASELTGINFTLDQNKVALKRGADEDNKTYEARVYFKGFYGEETYNIKVKLDVKEFDKIFLPLQRRNIIHSYSDASDCKGELVCHKLEELLASKLKALLCRQHSPDLYDFIFTVFFQKVIGVDKLEIIKTFLKKTTYETNPTLAKNRLLEISFQAFKDFWNRYLICPRQSLIAFEEAENQFKFLIPQMFTLLQPSYSSAVGGYGGAGGNSIDYVVSNYRNKIMEAGRTGKILKMLYDSVARYVEPYSLTYKTRQDGIGNEYFYAWDRTGGRSGRAGMKSFIQNKIQSVEITEESFEPRYPIELSKSGGYFGNSFATRTPSVRRPSVTRPKKRVNSFFGVIHTIECPVCNKRFKRSSYDTKLNKHKDRYGNQCYGRIGFIVN